MAVRSLGSLTLDLVAKIGGFTRGMTEAERVSDRSARAIANRQKQAAKEVEKAWGNASNLVKGAFAGLTIGAGIATFFRESREAQAEQAQLAAALKSTGEAAGFSAQQLNAMAASMAANSTFGEGDITRAQTRLLTYTNIVGNEFVSAMQSVIDMSARLGMSVEQSAETIGKALDIPSQGLTALSRQGFKFTEEQKKAVEQLEKTGQTAKAQQVVLEALQSAYEGAALAARNTFGGAISALQEEIRSLMTGSDGSLEGTRESIEELIKLLRSPEIKAAFATLTGLIADTVGVLVKGSAAFLQFGADIGRSLAIRINGDDTGIREAQAQAEALQGAIQRTTSSIERMSEALKRDPTNAQLSRSLDAARERLAQQMRDAAAVSEQLKRTATAVTPVELMGPPGSAAGGKPKLTPEEIERLARQRAAREAAEKAGKEAAKQAQAYLENLRKQLQATEDLTVAETVRRDIEAGRVKLAGGVTEKQLTDTARLIDAAKARAKSEEEVRKAMEATTEMQKRIDDAAIDEVEKLIQGNQALRDEIELIGKEGEARAAVEIARVSSAIALKEEALAMAQNAGASATVVKSLEREIELLKQRLGLLKDKGVREADAKATEEMLKRQEQAYKNIQDYLGQNLYDVATGNFDNIGKAFTNMLTRMAAEAVAADLMNSLFGTANSSGQRSGGSDWVKTAMNFAMSYFTGAPGRAAGGAVTAGGVYRVNENGPEMLEMNGQSYLMMGNRGGNVRPNSGGANVVNNFSVAAPMDRRTEAQMAQAATRGVQRAQRWM